MKSKQAENPKLRVVIYARQSSGADDRSESVELQLEKLQKYAELDSPEVTSAFSDLNTSGRLYPDLPEARPLVAMDGIYTSYLQQGNYRQQYRPGFGKALQALRDVDGILVQDIERFARPLEGSFLFNFLLNIIEGKHLFTLAGELRYRDFAPMLVTSIANASRDDAIKRYRIASIDGVSKKREGGEIWSGGVGNSYGYTTVIGKVTLIAEQAEVVREIYKQFLAGKSMIAICKYLNDHKTPTKRNGNAKFDNPKWRRSTVRTLLRNCAYAGLSVSGNGQYIKLVDFAPFVLVSESDWYKVQGMLADSSKFKMRATKGIHPLSGPVLCSCGAKMTVTRNRGAYRCSRTSYVLAKDLPEACRRVTIKETVETPIFAGKRIVGLLEALKPLLYKAIVDASKNGFGREQYDTERAMIETLLAKAESRERELSEGFARGDFDVTQLALYSRPLKDQKVRLVKELADLQEKWTAKESKKISNIQDALDKLNGSEIDPVFYQKYIRTVLTSVTVYADRVEVKLVDGTAFTLFTEYVSNRKTLPVPSVSDIFTDLSGKVEVWFTSQMGDTGQQTIETADVIIHFDSGDVIGIPATLRDFTRKDLTTDK